MALVKDRTGEVMGMLTAVAPEEDPAKVGRWWRYRCECGAECVRNPSVLEPRTRRGRVNSCGCHTRASRTTHDMTDTLIYFVWRNMRSRCHRATAKDYDRYGGRGIKVCAAWHDFATFYTDFGHKWKAGLQIDRIDNDGDYAPDNVRWVTPHENMRNRPGTIQVIDVSVAAASVGISRHVLAKRIAAGWPRGDWLLPTRSRRTPHADH